MALYMLWLSLTFGIGPVAVRKLLEHFSDPYAVYRADYEDLIKVKGIGKTAASSLVKSRSLRAAEAVIEKCDKQNIKIMTCLDPAYPSTLLTIPRAPVIFYYMGAEPRASGVVLVGSRKCTAYGKEVVCEAAAHLASRHIPVISGMAAGIDGYAHTACLRGGGYTMAFMGGGVDVACPSEHQVLHEKIAATGTVLSSFPPGTPAHPARFTHRNFFMAAWAETIVIIEAGHKSGALLTAEYGLELGKRVMAVPGSIYSRQSRGSNLLLAKGAELYYNPEQLTGPASAKPKLTAIAKNISHVENQPVLNTSQQKNNAALNAQDRDEPVIKPLQGKGMTALEEKILQILKTAPLSMDQLALSFKNDRAGFFEALAMLEIEGFIERLPGGMVGARPFSPGLRSSRNTKKGSDPPEIYSS